MLSAMRVVCFLPSAGGDDRRRILPFEGARRDRLLELYHHGSSACAAKVRFALEEKRLAWSGHIVDILRGEQFRAEFIALNPKAVVPVLVHDGWVLPESTVICEYLEQAFPENPIYPSSARACAAVRLWTKAVDEELHPACSALTYVASHRHTILRNGSGSFEEFASQGSSEGASARRLKWEWLQKGIEAPGAAERIGLYDRYMRKMDDALRSGEWLVENRFSMADITMAPYVNRLAALSMEGIWGGGRLPRLEAWFARVQSRPAFRSALLQWMPEALADEMRNNGSRSWPQIRELLRIS
jgi:ganglioside-induced differentiation-associated protein 1